jgi:aldehyde:ferredoxin oxidoreductase
MKTLKKILKIQLDNRNYELVTLPDRYLNLGGRGLTSCIISQEVPPECDALGKENKLIVAAGILAGTSVPNSGRLSIGAKSPLTGTIKETNEGGTAAGKLARLGIQAIVLEGCASELLSIKIEQNKVSFTPATQLSMLGNTACINHCRKLFGDHIAVISIGPAGEMGLKAASISVTSPDFLPRMGGGGGLGAVMGAKNIKTIIIDDIEGNSVEVKEKVLFNESVLAFTKGLLRHPLIRNLRPNSQASHRCMPGCVIKCSNGYTDKKGIPIVSGLKYETIALMGTNCLIKDIDIIARMNAVCNDAGVDAMEVGGALAVTMEAGLIPWGDGDKALEMVETISKGTCLGRTIGNGCKFTGEQLGVKRVTDVKGLCIFGYGDYDPSPVTGQVQVSEFFQRYFAAIDTLGLCRFASLPPLDKPELKIHLIDCVAAILDESLGEEYLMRLGEIILKDERKFNESAGCCQQKEVMQKD